MHLQTHMPTPASRETMHTSRSKRKQIVSEEHSLSTDGCCVILTMLQQTLRSNIHAIFAHRIQHAPANTHAPHAHRTETRAKRSCTNTYGKHNCMRTRCVYSIQMPTPGNVEQNTKLNRNQPGANKNSTHAIQKLREAQNTTHRAMFVQVLLLRLLRWTCVGTLYPQRSNAKCGPSSAWVQLAAWVCRAAWECQDGPHRCPQGLGARRPRRQRPQQLVRAPAAAQFVVDLGSLAAFPTTAPITTGSSARAWARARACDFPVAGGGEASLHVVEDVLRREAGLAEVQGLRHGPLEDAWERTTATNSDDDTTRRHTSTQHARQMSAKHEP